LKYISQSKQKYKIFDKQNIKFMLFLMLAASEIA